MRRRCECTCRDRPFEENALLGKAVDIWACVRRETVRAEVVGTQSIDRHEKHIWRSFFGRTAEGSSRQKEGKAGLGEHRDTSCSEQFS